MTDEEFMGLFSQDEIKDVTDVFQALVDDADKQAAAKKAAKPKKDGVWYDHDEKNADGHQLSVYAIVLGLKTVAWAVVNNDFTEIGMTPFGPLPDGVTPHAIFIHNAHRTDGWMSKGIALKTPHKCGTHIDTNSIRHYVMPRIAKIIARLYGV